MAARPLDIYPAALAEFKSALKWYLERNESAAGNFVVELDRAIDSVCTSPRRWPADEDGTRKILLNRFPFAVVYREKEDEVQVLAIAHGHRRPGYWEDRL